MAFAMTLSPMKATRLLSVIIGIAICTFPTAPVAQDELRAPPEMPPARSIPGITVEDQFPLACVDCHIDYTELQLDARLSTLMARWAEEVDPAVVESARAVTDPSVQLTGVHPTVDGARDDIPAACFDCHRSDAGDEVPLIPLLHKFHFGGGSEAVFLTVFQGECTHCHKFDGTTGQWHVPSAPER